MIVPDIVKDKWTAQPTTVELLKIELQAEKVKTQQMEARLSLLESTLASLIS